MLYTVKDLHQNVLCFAELCLNCSRSMVEASVFRSSTYLNAVLLGLKMYFGLIYGEFGALLPLVEDLHQKVLCFTAKVAT